MSTVPEFLLISNIKGSSLWINNSLEKDVDYSPFMYDARQYTDSYCQSLNNRDELLKTIINNCIVRPNVVKV